MVPDQLSTVDVPTLDPRHWVLKHDRTDAAAVFQPPVATRAAAVSVDLQDEEAMVRRAVARLATDADLRAIETEQKAFIAAVASKDHLAMSETNKNFHMAIAGAGKNAYMAAFYERLLDEGRRLLHLHFDYIERTRDGRLLTDEHEEMIEAIRARDVYLADRLAHAHSRQFRDNFLEFLKANYSAPIDFGAERP